MVLINDKKFACGTCIKGHRSSSCVHSDRPLFEIKKKGRPVTQCEHCRKLRQTKQLHIKCECGGKSESEATPQPVQVATTRKGVPGDIATFPNGLRDVHAMSAAADALQGLSSGGSATVKTEPIGLQNLLNPCRCRSGGKCTCCRPVNESAQNGHHSHDGSADAPGSASMVSPSGGHEAPSGSRTPLEQFRTRNNSTDNLAEMFRQKATTDPGITPASPSVRTSGHYHPAHTNPHVHKTKLFSPYDNSSGSIAGQRRGSDLSRRSSSRSQAPNMHHRVSNETTMVEPHIPPLNPAFLAGATTEATLPSINFPTGSMIHLSGCTCGDNCRCPGCSMHDIPEEPPQADGGDFDMTPADHCPNSCTSCFDCRSSATLPPGLQSIDELLTAAAAAIPPPKSTWRPELSPLSIDPHNLNILPPVAVKDEMAAEAMGYVKLKPLQCCSGRCQCQPGDCNCMSDCCGCCIRCECADPNSPAPRASPGAQVEPVVAPSSCCGGSATEREASETRETREDASLAPATADHADHEPVIIVSPDTEDPPPAIDLTHAEITRARSPSIHAPSGRKASSSRGRSSPLGNGTLPAPVPSIKPKPIAAVHHPRPILPRPPSNPEGASGQSTPVGHVAKAPSTVPEHAARPGPKGDPPRSSSGLSHRPSISSQTQTQVAVAGGSLPLPPSAMTAISNGVMNSAMVDYQALGHAPTAQGELLSLAPSINGAEGPEQPAFDPSSSLFPPQESPALIDFGPMAGLPDLSTDAFDTTAFDADLPELTPSEIEAWLQQVMHQQDPAPAEYAFLGGDAQ